ncbi:hypothetical protein QR680_018124 [Steinernema hermaphroditum]|uniref:Protein MCM10 homolog n=1 Tax=Steinernema hermaphroditum TaxID=289476 RepID=A0AA39LQI1_9BILA|nr:hypothetical protein QR680_018124 [Steinernema hermaphroditum]
MGSQDMSQLIALLGADPDLNDENHEEESFFSAKDASVADNTATESFYTVRDTSVANETAFQSAETTPVAMPHRRLVDLDFEAPTYKGPSLAEMMGGSKSTPSEKILPDDLSSDEDEFERNHDEDAPTPLSKAGKELKKRLANPNHVNRDAAAAAAAREALQKKAVAARVIAPPSSQKYGAPFDTFFGLPTISPKVAPTTFQTYAEGMQKVNIMQTKRRVGVKGDWITMAVIVERSEIKKSASGKEYMIWNMSDLYDCQQKAVKVLLFGDCVRDHWKIQVGTLIALTNADCDTDAKTGDVTVKLFKSNQVMEIGQCPLFAYCKASKKDGDRCKSFVNLSVSDHCAYHIQSAANRLASKRGTFNTGMAAMPKKLFDGKPLGDFSNYFYQGKMVSAKSAPLKTAVPASSRPPIDAPQPKGLYVSEPQIRDNEKKTLNQIISSGNIHHRGARNLISLRNKGSAALSSSSASTAPANKPLAGLGSPPAAGKPKCLRDFKIDNQKKAAIAAAGPPKLGRCFEGGQMISLASPKKRPTIMTKEEIVKQRAINLIKRQGGIEKVDPNAAKRAKKRALIDPSTTESSRPSTSSGTPAKKSCFGGSELSKEELMALINKKSSHDDEVVKDDMNKQNAYFNAMEVKERIETNVTELKEVKNCNVVTCKKCGYTNHKQSDYCKTQGHAVVKHKADKRWYKCRGCSSRLICYELMPTRPCQSCGAMDFERVGMKDERKVAVKDKLLVRGEEQKFL